MRQSALTVGPSALTALLVLGLALPACKHHAPGGPPPVAPPVAPATPPPAPPPVAPEVAPQVEDPLAGLSSAELESRGLLADIHFDFDSAELRDADRQVLTQNADFLKSHAYIKVTVEGHCDERGTVEYNLALGERRARNAYDYLVSLGVPADRLKTVSYGKEIPLCQDSNESCWARNRRAHFAITGKVQ
jgi:peptidoglycan-associated lipoprotein